MELLAENGYNMRADGALCNDKDPAILTFMYKLFGTKCSCNITWWPKFLIEEREI